MSHSHRRLVFGGAVPSAPAHGAVLSTATQRDLEDEAEYYPDDAAVRLVFKPGTEGRRLRPVPDAVAANTDSTLFGRSPNWAYRGYIVHATSAPTVGSVRAGPLGNAPPQPLDADARRAQLKHGTPAERVLCLFNVVVALEWLPTADYLRRLRWAFRRGSDFLYDVTDGKMAFGQVVFGGPELMPYADIQIMASSRIHPRAWVDGLHKPEKYTPIRLGRGLWPSRNGVVIDWDEPEGYRTIVHEWGHYALGLRDQYFERRALIAARDAGVVHAHSQLLTAAHAAELATYTVLMGKQATASESVMATLEGTSELVPRTSGSEVMRKSAEWDEIERRFPWLGRPERPLEGPGRLPLPLPLFQTTRGLQEAQPGAEPALLPGALPPGFDAHEMLVFLLRDGTGLMAQGGPDARFDDDGLALLGAQIGDLVVLVGATEAGYPAVYGGAISGFETRAGVYEVRIDNWQMHTARTPLAVDVIPDEPPVPGNRADLAARIRVRVGVQRATEPLAAGEVLVFVAGTGAPQRLTLPAVAPGDQAASWSSPTLDVSSLDGFVLVRQGRALGIVGYSHGGNPPSSTPANAPPISAGSSDSSVMLFFDEDASGQHDDYSRIKVVTTLHCGARGRFPHPAARPLGESASLGANAALPAHLSPTLLLRYEQPGERELLSGDVLVCRLVDGVWSAMPTYLRPGATVAAMPMTAATAGSLLAEHTTELRVERFQTFWVPRS